MAMEIDFRSPEIKAKMDSRQFALLLDVIRELLSAPMPRPTWEPRAAGGGEVLGEVLRVARRTRAGRVGSAAPVPGEMDIVTGARMALVSIRWQLSELEADIRALRNVSSTSISERVGSGMPMSATPGPAAAVAAMPPAAVLAAAVGEVEAMGRGAHSFLIRPEEAAASLKGRSVGARPGVRVSAGLDSANLNLLRGGAPFATASLGGLSYISSRADEGGKTTVLLQSLHVADHGADRPLLAPWSPSEAWSLDPMVRAISESAPASAGSTALTHLEIVLHPMTLHATERGAARLQEYFFPGLDAGEARDASEGFLPGGPPGRARTAARRSLTGAPQGELPPPPGGSPSRPSLRRSVASSRHARHLSLDSAALGVTDDVGDRASDVTPVGCDYVRFNEFHIRLSYEGAPVSFREVPIVLDARVYHGLSIRDVFNRYKWDAIKSILKSVTGLQGRKVKALLPTPAAPPGPGSQGREGDGEGSSGAEAGAKGKMRKLFNMGEGHVVPPPWLQEHQIHRQNLGHLSGHRINDKGGDHRSQEGAPIDAAGPSTSQLPPPLIAAPTAMTPKDAARRALLLPSAPGQRSSGALRKVFRRSLSDSGSRKGDA